MACGPPKVMKTKVGRTPRSARVPLEPLFLQQADEGVGCGPGGPPHLRLQGSVTHTPVVVALPRGGGSEAGAGAFFHSVVRRGLQSKRSSPAGFLDVIRTPALPYRLFAAGWSL